MVAGFRSAVPHIPGRPSPYGLLHNPCIEVVTGSVHEMNGTDSLALACGSTGLWYQCDATPGSPTPDNPAAKTFDRPTAAVYEPVSVYAGLTCSTFGFSFDEGQVAVLEQLSLGEQRALESFYMERVLCGYAAGNDLTPAAGALSSTVGIGLLESWLATNYGGVGVLHVPIGAAAMLGRDRIVNEFGDPTGLRTLAGNCVVLGGGYSANLGPATPGPGCEVADAGEMWIYITPPVRVRRSDPVLVAANEGQSVRSATNDRFALAESAFVVETACPIAAAVRVVIC